MTAETLKPFLSLTNGNMLTSSEMDENKRKGKTLLLLLFIGLILIFSVTVLSLLIIYMVKVNQLQEKINEIEHKLVETRKHFRFAEYDELKDLDDFENTYNRNRNEDEDDTIYLDGKDDVSLYGKQRNTSEYDDNTFLDDEFGSGDYEYDDEDEESLELYDDDNVNNNDGNDDDKNNIYEDIRKSQLKRNRQRRALAGLTRQGVPIMEESYLERRNRTSTDHLDPLLTGNNVHQPRMKLDWNDSRIRNAQNHHRRYHHQTMNHVKQQHQSAPPSHHRPAFRSEHAPVSRTEDKIVLTDRNGAPRYAQEAIQAPIEYAPPPSRPILAAPKAKLRSHGLHRFAVQFMRDPREVSHRGHHVRDGIIYNDWMLRQTQNLAHVHHFIQIDAGVVKIKVEGLYYVYAQISYDKNFGTNSFIIERNQSPELQCADSPTPLPNPSTCYTGGVLYLKPNDMIYVKDVNIHKSNIKDPHKSFFGIIKLS